MPGEDFGSLLLGASRPKIARASRLRSLPIPVDRALLRLVKILGADQPSFERTKQEHAGRQGDRQGREEVDPDRRLECRLEPKGKAQSGNSNRAHRKERRAVGGVGERIVELANLATLCQGQIAAKQMSALTPRTQSPDAGQHRVVGGVPLRSSPIVLVHVNVPSISGAPAEARSTCCAPSLRLQPSACFCAALIRRPEASRRIEPLMAPVESGGRSLNPPVARPCPRSFPRTVINLGPKEEFLAWRDFAWTALRIPIATCAIPCCPF